MQSNLPANLLAEFAKAKIFVQSKAQSKLVIRSIILIIRPGIAYLYLFKQRANFQGKSIEPITTVANVQLLSTQMIVAERNLKVITNVDLCGYYEVTKDLIEGKLTVTIGGLKAVVIVKCRVIISNIELVKVVCSNRKTKWGMLKALGYSGDKIKRQILPTPLCILF